MFASVNPAHVGVRVPFEEGVAYAKRHGFSGFDFDVKQAVELGSARALELLKSSGLRAGAWNLPFVPYNVDDATYRAGLEDLKTQARVAKEIGGLRAAMWIMPSHNERGFRQNFAFHLARFRPVAEILDGEGVRLGLEFIGPKTSRGSKHLFVHSLDGMRALACSIGPNVGLLLDSWHHYTSGGTVDDLRGLSRDEVVHVHINDAPAGLKIEEQIDNRRKLPLATGLIDLAGFMRALAEMDYDGPVTAEPFDQELREQAPDVALAATAKATIEAVGLATRS
jgi:sugar phosphate isomerase/epimerase